MLFVVVQSNGRLNGGVNGGIPQEDTVGGLEFTGIWPGSTLDARNTAKIALSTVSLLGKLGLPGQPLPARQDAHLARAAVLAPCCAAWVIVE
jgi:hypothetical protein